MPEHRYGSASIPEPLNWRKLWPFLGYKTGGGEVGVGGRSDVGFGMRGNRCGGAPVVGESGGVSRPVSISDSKRGRVGRSRGVLGLEMLWSFLQSSLLGRACRWVSKALGQGTALAS